MPRRSQTEVPLAEWIVAGVGLVVFVGVVGLMLYEAFAGDQSPPQIGVQVETIFPSGDGYLLKFRAMNGGGETAAEVVIEGKLKSSSGEEEEATATLDFLPPHSERIGGFFFKTEPRPELVELRATSYREP